MPRIRSSSGSPATARNDTFSAEPDKLQKIFRCHCIESSAAGSGPGGTAPNRPTQGRDQDSEALARRIDTKRAWRECLLFGETHGWLSRRAFRDATSIDAADPWSFALQGREVLSSR